MRRLYSYHVDAGRHIVGGLRSCMLKTREPHLWGLTHLNDGRSTIRMYLTSREICSFNNLQDRGQHICGGYRTKRTRIGYSTSQFIRGTERLRFIKSRAAFRSYMTAFNKIRAAFISYMTAITILRMRVLIKEQSTHRSRGSRNTRAYSAGVH